ncbi:unnamed protein product [Rhizophagus irregularis]|nr:unnamed protein product [Rhizophagus irregularis]
MNTIGKRNEEDGIKNVKRSFVTERSHNTTVHNTTANFFLSLNKKMFCLFTLNYPIEFSTFSKGCWAGPGLLRRKNS